MILPPLPPLLIPSPLFRLISWMVFHLPGRDALKMAEFSHVELGSGMDMLAATADQKDPLLRRKYYIHAMEELKHSRLFRERARALSARTGRGDRVQAVLDDSGFIGEHGIRDAVPLHRRHDELQFLAFVWLHERAGATQFEVYSRLMADDTDSRAMFEEIARDERFHIAYSRTELERRAAAGQLAAVRWAVLQVRARDLWQAWGRKTHAFGVMMSGFWLGVLYFLVASPFGLIARWKERLSGGLQPVSAPSEARIYATEMF
jgi:hypothetical protein